MGTLVQLKERDNKEYINIVKYFLENYGSENTVKAYTNIIKDFFKVKDINDIQNYYFKKVTYVTVHDYINNMIINGKSKSTIKQTIGCLRKLFRYANNISNGENGCNYFADESIKDLVNNKCDKVKIKEDALTKEDVKFIIGKIRSGRANTEKRKLELIRDELLFKFMITTGLRESEIINFKLEDVQYSEQDDIYYFIVKGKGRKERCVELYTPIYEQLKEWDKIKPYSNLWGFNSVSNINKLTDRWSDITGIKIHPHLLRATCATNNAINGMPLPNIQAMLGHSNINTTMIYVRNKNKYNQGVNKYTNYDDIF